MRAGWIVVALVACGHAEPPPPVAPKGPTPCARAADAMVQTMLDRLAARDAPPTEAADGFRNLIRERCEQDGWSAEATRCLIAMTSTDDAAPCATLMTDAQQAALVRDEQAQFGAQPGAGRKSEKPKGNGLSGDPSGGGEEPPSSPPRRTSPR